MDGIGSFIGAGLDGFSSIASAIQKGALAHEQTQQAKKLADESQRQVAPPLQREFQQALNLKNSLATQGIPNIQSYNDTLDQHAATALRKAREASGSGADLLGTLSGLNANTNNSKVALSQQDAQARSNNISNLVDTMWSVGSEKNNNDAIKRMAQQRLNAQSGALSNAATANKFGAVKSAITGIGSIASNAFAPGAGLLMGAGKDGAPVTPKDDSGYWENRVDGQNASPTSQIMPTDNTNLAGGQQIQTQPSSGNMDWTTFGLH